MGLLTPLYALAALAIVGPILFHLIRRQPQGQHQFSSLMFLQPSPPTLTRRSRIDNWLLLLLRALAIGLIAMAFARPYWREESLLQTNLAGRNIVVVLDTSASMQRSDVWESAQNKLHELLDSLSQEDRIALYTLDENLKPIVALDPKAQAATTREAVRQAAEDLEPSWRATRLGNGLSTLADTLSALRVSGQIAAGKSSEMVLLTDLHQDSALESLQGYPWPELVTLDVRQVLPSLPGNARASLMTAEPEEDETLVKVRIENNSDSSAATFELSWANETGLVDGVKNSRVQVPAGQVRVFPMPPQPPSTDRIQLVGDAWSGDNEVFVAKAEARIQRVLYIAAPREEKEDDPGYFLSVAPLSTPLITREIVAVRPSEFANQSLDDQVGSVVLEPHGELIDQADSLREFASSGGNVLLTLAHETESTLAQSLIDGLLNVEGTVVKEAKLKDEYALIGWVNYRNPTFAPFADPRFNDFSKIRFWSYRSVEFPNSAALVDATQTNEVPSNEIHDGNASVIAKYDSGDTLLLHQTCGSGHIWILTAGWQPTSSGLALSSKFLPILSGIFDPEGQSRRLQPVFEVGESIATSELVSSISDVQGNVLTEEQATIGDSSYTIWQPGLYSVQIADKTQQIAVQVPASESHLTPMDSDIFEQYGIELGKVASDFERQQSARQMQVEELEGKQRLWQWLIAGCILILAVESFLAGRIARKQSQPATAAS